VFGNPDAMAVFDMGNYQERHSVERFTGAQPGYVGFEEGGQLTRCVIENPFSVLLFDEVEKANPSIWRSLLSLLDVGRMKDSSGRTAYFGDSIVIFTSNVGQRGFRDWVDAQGGGSPDYDAVCTYYKSQVEEYCTRELGLPELLNRLGDSIVGFDLLRDKHVREIAGLQFKAAQYSMRSRYRRNLAVDDSILNVIAAEMARPENQVLGGRRIRELVRRYVLIPASQAVLDDPTGTAPIVVRC